MHHRTAERTRVCTSAADLQALIVLARRVNQLAAQHGVAPAEAQRLAEDELGAGRPGGGPAQPPNLTTEKCRYPELAEMVAADTSRPRPATADDATVRRNL
ncbi:hypothetical protein [Sphaerobacter sp.]|uniref:hypothetical protein n=1 Tax=Sphaerobacter sp. TaxID=2099654 RepID=UPI001DB5B92F|nr:hypothetical protein [Sphaerobacter sp.]MBX5446625.1 hypothetical protein [Sphaerobacter sp.]